MIRKALFPLYFIAVILILEGNLRSSLDVRIGDYSVLMEFDDSNRMSKVDAWHVLGIPM